MAPETKSKKRKSGGAVTSPSTKKPRKSEAPSPEEQPAPVKASKKPKKDAPKQETEVATTRSKSSRKRATDFFEEEADAAEKSTPKKSKKAKKEKDEEPAEEPVEEPAPVVKAVKGKKAKKEKVEEPAEEPAPAAKAVKGKKRKAAEEPAPVEEPAEEEETAVDGSDDESVDEDDQTKALLKGFESDEDEVDGEDEGDLSKLPALPDSKKLAKQLKKAKGDDSPGVIYIGRVPHGFYEHQMKAYFTQFGQINRVRLARNKKTGRSKHYAFVEFANNDVAKIVAETMDKYLMFGHILQVRYIPAEQVHPELFKGSNKRFKAAPRNKMQGRHLRLGMVREDWDKRIEREERRRKSKEDKLKEMDYEFEAPAIKTTSKVPKKTPAEAEEAPKTLTEKPHDEEDQEVAEAMETVKKSKKSKKRESTGAVEEEKEKEPVKVKAAKKEKTEKADKKASKPKTKKAKTSA